MGDCVSVVRPAALEQRRLAHRVMDEALDKVNLTFLANGKGYMHMHIHWFLHTLNEMGKEEVICNAGHIIGAGGSLTGYRGGLELKKRLLDLETIKKHAVFCIWAKGNRPLKAQG